MRSEGWVIDTIVSLTLAKWETVFGRFGGYLTRLWSLTTSNAELKHYSGSSAQKELNSQAWYPECDCRIRTCCSNQETLQAAGSTAKLRGISPHCQSSHILV